jgi:uncharacterized protein (TIGR00369 family)
MAKDRRRGLMEHLGIAERLLAPGRVACTLVTDERHQNIQGVLHGSVTMALMDTAMGHAMDSLLAAGEFCSTTQLSIQYLKAARPGETLAAEGKVTHRGRRVAYLEGECRNGAGELIARAHGTWYVGLVRPGPAG